MLSLPHLSRHSSSRHADSTWLHRAALLAIVLAGLLFVSCNSPFAHTVAQNTDVCSILTTQEVGHVLGTAVHSQPSSDNALTSKDIKETVCLYTATDPNALVHLVTALSIAPDASTAQAGFNNAKQSAQAESPIENVDGLGDGAFFQSGILRVLKDNVILSVSALVTRDSTDSKPAQKRGRHEATGPGCPEPSLRVDADV